MRTGSGIRPKSLALAVEVRVPAEGRSFAALTSRLTVEGVFVSTFHTIALGTAVIVELALPSGTVRAEGTVAPAPSVGVAGFSVIFDDLSTMDRARIAEAIGFAA